MKNINLRLDDDLHGRLKHIADLDRRSLQQEIIFLLNRACNAFDAEQQAGADSGTVYVHVSGEHVIVTNKDDGANAKPIEVYRFGPDGESWMPGWRELGQQIIGDEATHHDADSVIGRAAQKIHAEAVTKRPPQDVMKVNR